MTMRALRTITPAALACAALALPAGAAGAINGRDHAPGELVVGYVDGTVETVDVAPGRSLAGATRELERRRGVRFAHPNWIARASYAVYDQGSMGEPGAWRREQWNFLGKPGGVRAEAAWKRVARRGRPGATGVTVAVVDSGVAYAAAEGFAASPDFAPARFVPGFDFVDDDREPLDENGHGTHVAGTIAEETTVGSPSAKPDYLTGLAYGSTLMPVRVLDDDGTGLALDVAEGVDWAAEHGADVINLSLQLPAEVQSCSDVPELCAATRRAKRAGALVVGAAGNSEGGGLPHALFPAAAPAVLGVGATTEHGCLAAYSNYGPGVDVLAPGGGPPAPPALKPRCEGDAAHVYQLTYACFPGLCHDFSQFAIRPDVGTSMAAAHASGVAALVRASGRASTPRALTRRLVCTARRAKPKEYYGRGLLDAGRAIAATCR